MRLLVIAAFFTGLLGCTAPQMGSKQSEAKPNSESANKIVTTKSEKPVAATAVEKLPIKKRSPAETQKELTGEVLYYLFSAEVAVQRGKTALAAALYVKAAEVTRDPRVARQATRTAYYIRNDKLSLKAARLWHELEPTNVEAHQILAALLVRVGQTKSAIKHFEYVLEHGKRSERQSFMLITSLLSKEKNKKVGLEVMQKLISTRQKNPNAIFAYSQLAFMVGELKDAAATIQKVIKLKPEWTEAYILQSNIFTRQGYKAHALEVLQKTVSDQYDNKKLRMYYARKLVDAKQFEEASKQFSILVDDFEANDEARYALGLLALQMNKPSQAEDHFTALLENKKRIPESQYYLAQSFEAQNKLDKAVEWYEKVHNHQYSFESELRIAVILAKQGKLKVARQQLQNISPDSLDKELRIYLTEGEILNDAKKYEEAMALYTEALLQLTNNSRLLYARALTAEKLDKIDEAVADLENIVKREPANAQALNALGYTLVDKTDRLEDGLGYIKKAIKLSPDDPAILDSLGWAYYRLGQYSESVKFLRRAFEKLKDAEVAAHLGEVLWVAGDREEAQEIWNAALQQTPDDNLLLNVIQKFAE